MCLEVHHKTDHFGIIKGQHCLFQFRSRANDTVLKSPELSIFNSGWKNLSSSLGGAVCLPASCSAETVSLLLEFLMKDTGYELATDYNQADFCKTTSSLNLFSNNAVLTLFFVVLLVFLTLFSFFADYQRNLVRNQWISAFSIIKNVSNLLDTKNVVDDEVKCFHFLRVLFAVMVILWHVFYVSVSFPSNHQPEFFHGVFPNLASVAGCFVNGFFVISGFLSTKTILKEIKT